MRSLGSASRASNWLTLLQAVVLATGIIAPAIAPAQLAITEVMAYPGLSYANTNGADFWELTNFGTNAIGISDLQMADDRDSWVSLPAGLVIGPNESIVFFQTKTNGLVTADQFRDWWGLPPSIHVFPLDGMPGLARFGDTVRLRDNKGDIAAQVKFEGSLRGISKVFNAVTGEFGVDITETTNLCPAIIAIAAPEIGSPGMTCGVVPLRLLIPPTNQFAPLGCCAEFAVRVAGMPPPKYQWEHNGVPIGGATANSLRICDLTPTSEGTYCVRVTNGLEELPTLCAELTLATNWSAPVISTAPKNCTVIPGQTAVFSAGLCGYPVPALQWYVKTNANSLVCLDFETSPTLVIYDCQTNMDGWTYCLQASNEVGVVTSDAVLTVVTNGTLRITEAMARSTTNTANSKIDWIEITSFGPKPLDLSGFRFVASRGGGLDGASIIPQGINIRPNESIICVEALTRDEFVAWYGAENLPHDIQVVTWWGWGISPDGDEYITLWNQSTEDPNLVIDQVATGPFTESVSSYYGDDCLDPRGCVSTALDRGTFFAVHGAHLGSLGYEAAPNLHIRKEGSELVLTGRSRVGRTYSLQYKTSLDDTWKTVLPPKQASGAAVVFREASTMQNRFYRLEEIR